MLDRLPVFIDPLSFSERGKRLSGAIKLSELNRLSSQLLDNSGEVEVDLSFDKEGKLSTIQGVINANLMLECQSCLKQVVFKIDRNFKLGLVTTLEQADRLVSDTEPFMLQDKKILLSELVEDELLLALPDFPKHEYDCVDRNGLSKNNEIENEQKELNNPFSVLEKLKNTGD